MKRKRTYVVLASLCLITFFAIALSYARSGSIGSGHSSELTANATPGGQIPAQATLGAFVARDLPVTLTEVVATGGRGQSDKAESLPRLQMKVVGKGVTSVRNVSLSLFEFDAGGGLRRVDGWVRRVNLTDSRGMADVTIELERRFAPNSRLMLSVDRVNADTDTWETPFLTLAQAARQAAAGAPDADARVDRSGQPAPDLAGAALCSYAQGRAMWLAQAGDKGGYTSFTCDQSERSYSITFASKRITSQ